MPWYINRYYVTYLKLSLNQNLPEQNQHKAPFQQQVASVTLFSQYMAALSSSRNIAGKQMNRKYLFLLISSTEHKHKYLGQRFP